MFCNEIVCISAIETLLFGIYSDLILNLANPFWIEFSYDIRATVLKTDINYFFCYFTFYVHICK